MDYPSNSRNPKEPTIKEPVTAVVTGPVVFQDKSQSRKLKDLLIVESPEQAFQGVIFDVVLPAIKDLILDSSWSMLERILGGSSRRPGSRLNTIPGMRPNPPVNYSQMHKQPQVPIARSVLTAQDQFQIQDIVMQNRGEMEFVLEGISNLIERYEQASVSDLYSLLGRSAPYTYENWGWVDIREATIRRLRGGEGYILDLPQPITLK